MNRYESSKLDHPAIRAALFHPRREEKSEKPPFCREIEIEVDDDVVLGCRFFQNSADAVNILYFHGNGETVGDYDEIGPLFLKAGLNICVVGYRGYGWSGGSPSVSSLYRDTIVALDFFIDYCEENKLCSDIFVMGRSLGSAFSIDIGYSCPERIKGIIIDSGFAYSLPLAMRLGYNVRDSGLSEEDCFNNLAKITEVEIPTLLLHGAEDQLIPLSEAVKLQAESGAKNKQLFIVPGADHNSLFSRGGSTYFETIKNFTDTVTGRNTWRQRRRKFRSQEKKT